MRSLTELLSDDPAWPLVKQQIASARNEVEVLEAREPARSDTLHALQVTTRSPMGALAYETGGLLVDHGWLRILGSGNPRMPRTLVDWNRGRAWHRPGSPPALLLVADDVVGGSFAVNGGALAGPAGHVHYFAPDELEWECLDVGYSDFLSWAFSGDLEAFYSDLRWPGWQEEVAPLPGDRGISVYPFLWAAGPPVASRSRTRIPMAELVDIQFDARRQVGGDEGGSAQSPSSSQPSPEDAKPRPWWKLW